MKYFRKLGAGLEVGSLLDEVRRNDDAWLFDVGRQTKIPAQKDTNTIFLRAPLRRPDLHVNENQESDLTRMGLRFPYAIKTMTHFAKALKGALSRATIVRLKAGSQVGRHIDTGSYYLIRDRYHLVLQSELGSVLSSGDERVRMWPGELWWFDNKQHHFATNESDDWRIHYIFDLLPEAHKHLGVNPILPIDSCGPS